MLTTTENPVEHITACTRLAQSLVAMGLGERIWFEHPIQRWLEVMQDPDSDELIHRAAVGAISGFTNNYLRDLLGDASEVVAVQIRFLGDSND